VDSVPHSTIFFLADEEFSSIWTFLLFAGLSDHARLVPGWSPLAVASRQQERSVPLARVPFAEAGTADRRVFAAGIQEVTEDDALTMEFGIGDNRQRQTLGAAKQGFGVYAS
jgi:hypothetical protein